ncbi:UNVERIFIED_CONTAM: hypothetical protein FKN15_053232 [Acipenser sinensis]
MVGLSFCCPQRRYHVVRDVMTWDQARQHCQSNFIDLVSVRSEEEMQAVKALISRVSDYCFLLGLRRNTVHSPWEWSTGEAFQYNNWASQEPPADGECVAMNPSGVWLTGRCDDPISFVCLAGPSALCGQREYFLVHTVKNADEAREHCRSLYTDLVSITSQDVLLDIEQLMNKDTSNIDYWIGLRRNGRSWGWGNGETFNYSNWGETWSTSDCVTIKTSDWNFGTWQNTTTVQSDSKSSPTTGPAASQTPDGGEQSQQPSTMGGTSPRASSPGHSSSWLSGTSPAVTGLERYLSLGDTVTLPCAGFQKYENSLILWIFSQRSESSELASDGKITVKQPERAARLEVLPDSSLRIHHLHTEDAGRYECQQYVNGQLYEGGTPVVLNLLTITADPGRDLKRGTSLALQCTLVCNGGIADCSPAPDNVELTWVDDEGTALQGDRFKITTYRTHSTLSLELQTSDHDRRWRCDLTEGGEVKASYSYTTTLTGEDVYSTVGRFIHFPCAKTAQLEAGQQLIWSFKRSGTTSWKTLFTFFPSGNVLTNAEEVDKNRLAMAVNTSLLISSVQIADSGLYRCSQHNDSNHQKHLQVLVLNVLSGSADRISPLQEGSNVTLTCSLTCGFVCPPAKLLWSDSNGIILQGGAREGFLIRSNITSSQLFVTGLQSSEQIRCSVEEEGKQRVYLQYLIQVSAPGG